MTAGDVAIWVLVLGTLGWLIVWMRTVEQRLTLAQEVMAELRDRVGHLESHLRAKQVTENNQFYNDWLRRHDFTGAKP